MSTKVLICLYGNEVSPRFDLAREVLIANIDRNAAVRKEKEVVLPQASVEILCHMIFNEGIQIVVCGGIEEELYQYLQWKNVKVLDSVIGDGQAVLQRLAGGMLRAGDIVNGDDGKTG
ncbi:MAG: NifB/NifX family molybdenum-iron cluster-binding protein [Thermodesulfobacteriota bacterium]